MQSKESIAGMWVGRVLRTCPHASFLASEPDPFRNPIGHSIRKSLEALLDELMSGMDRERIERALDPLMQIRAVQDLPPGRALEFLFQLKDILRLHDGQPGNDLLDGRIDTMALVAFDLYMKYRERTYEARAHEARRRVYVLEECLRPHARTDWHERERGCT